MKKRKEKEYFTIDGDLRIEFLKYCEEHNLNKSKIIESLIKEYMGKVKKTKEIKIIF
jgi:hypothetical protein